MNLIHDLDLVEKEIFKSVSNISYCIRNSNPIDLSSIVGIDNSCGDKVKELDIKCNDIMKDNLSNCSLVKCIGSEEEEKLIEVNKSGKYLVSFYPLDGSSNIDANITVGTIFCVFEYNNNNTIIDGSNIVMSGYSLYGGCTQLIICKHNKVLIYGLDPTNDNWIILNDNFKMSNKGTIYSVNESNKYIYNNKINNYIDDLIINNYTSRWVGSLVADFHRTLIKSGVVFYPSNKKNKTGRIRLLYEAYPLAYIIENAGGKSSDGKNSLLENKFPWFDIHKKVSIYYGSYYEMDKLKEFFIN